MATTIKSGFPNSISSHDEAIIQKVKNKQQQQQQQHGNKFRDFNFKPLMRLVHDIFHHSLFSSGSIGQQKGPEESSEKAPGSSNPIEKLELHTHLHYTIHRLAWEITCKCGHRKEVHETTEVLLDLLSDYSWEAKVVLILSAFSMTYGEFWLTTAPQPMVPSNPLLQSLSILKQPPCLLKLIQTSSSSSSSSSSAAAATLLIKLRFEALQSLVEQMLDVANYILELKEHKVHYYLNDETSTEEAVELASYLIIASVVTCISSNMALLKITTESYSTSLDSDIQILKKFHHMMVPVHDYLHKQLYSTADHQKVNIDKQSALKPPDNTKTAKTNDVVLHQPRRAMLHFPLQQPRWRF